MKKYLQYVRKANDWYNKILEPWRTIFAVVVGAIFGIILIKVTILGVILVFLLIFVIGIGELINNKDEKEKPGESEKL